MRAIDNARHILGFDAPRRGLQVRDDDVFLTSYPRSGNTWVRFIITSLVRGGGPVGLEDVQGTVPDIYKVSKRRLSSSPSPRILKSHEYFDPRYRRVIYLVRDPRDVAVSYFLYQQRSQMISQGRSIERFLFDFLEGRADGLGTWSQHVASWLSTHRDDPDLLLIRYEDLVLETLEEVRKIAEFLNLGSVDDQTITAAIKAASITKMRTSESEAERRKGLSEAVTYVGKGEIGSWKSGLPPAFEQKLRSAFLNEMRLLGYADDS